ncbi:MAG: hypothetical protein QG572_919 [Pseudomonadota bacterium]|jgi:hypothetical protein|nr:hypothetical protein [Pseudomonadota bacterium]
MSWRQVRIIGLVLLCSVAAHYGFKIALMLMQ